MKVKELVERLSYLNQEDEVKIWFSFYGLLSNDEAVKLYSSEDIYTFAKTTDKNGNNVVLLATEHVINNIGQK